MTKYLPLSILILFVLPAHAALIRGTVTSNKGEPLPFATVMIKGTTQGTTANAEGAYQLDIPQGSHVIVCQYMGYRKEEKTVRAGDATQELNFVLQPLSMQIKEVVVKSGGEDPAYAIIRQAIKKRSFYQSQVKNYTVESYIKMLARLRSVPKRVFGQKIDKEEIGVDSTGKGIVSLSESVTKISYRAPDMKLDVLSSRQSGGGLGFSIPMMISFYDNNVEAVTSQLGPRGFISPISENALFYYKYRLEGTFMDDNKLVNKIKVIPRRKYEPVFAGYIFITEDDWRIHSTDLMLTKEYQLELLDTLVIRQTHVPVNADVWRTKDQVVYVATKLFGFDVVANSVNVYSNYNLSPVFPKGYFNKVVMKYEKNAEFRGINYWDSIRPVPLEVEEQKDFRVKDSTAQARRDSAKSKYHLDSLRAKPQPVKPTAILFGGWGHTWYFQRNSDSTISSHRFNMGSLIRGLSYNTVEGVSLYITPSVVFSLPNKRTLGWHNNIRYGFNNTHLNAYTSLVYAGSGEGEYGTRNVWNLSGGKRITQFNRGEPIGPIMNSLYTLLLKENYMKLYESWFGSLNFNRNFESTFSFGLGVTYENRRPVENTTDFVLFKNADKTFTPNHPEELANIPFVREEVLSIGGSLSYQPGQRFIEYPNRKVAMGSKYPTFTASYRKGLLDADFDKWNIGITDNMNFKLFGELRYHFTGGGFLNNKKVSIPDMQHFNGNQTFLNIRYLNSFQLAPYYQYSTTANLYGTANVEHHFNGLLTNRIPLFNRLKWHLVAGSNAFYVNRDNNYVEVFAGLENIFKVLRVDVVAGYQSQADTRIGVRLGFGGLLGSAFRFE
ncbi:DUF5686 and carboxypeptidase regulatory-like domain-containing protein [Chitinophaga barathri]|uniref:Carboxypeptidase-like regulatory domain-containing protein n=1 Tax=Chitinophaga barathri TaxID=1647451 RepID=A0A3N4MDK0_9BACT|nr:DUF5686 and carboxypeptidase regulatory-like domain-containing protein [Chitinophaga barathri]RPD38170.1 carboxypeptidase-like regulatory domain-containing protein [Chitinophaga barathri]